MKPRGYFGNFIVVAPLSGLLFTLLTLLLFYSFIKHLGFGEFLIFLLMGSIFGLLFGSVMAFFWKEDTVSLTFKDKESFLRKLDIALLKIGYRFQNKREDVFTYIQSLRLGSLIPQIYPKIYMQIETNTARIVCPKIYIKKLQKQLQTNNIRYLIIQSLFKKITTIYLIS